MYGTVCNGAATTLSLGLQVCKCYLLWGLKYVNMAYFGLFGAPGFQNSGIYCMATGSSAKTLRTPGLHVRIGMS